MKRLEDEFFSQKYNHTELTKKLEEIENHLIEKNQQLEAKKQELELLEAEFNALGHNRLWRLFLSSKDIKKTARTIAAYVLGRRNRKQLYSKTYKQKHAENQLKPYKSYLYDLGMVDKALHDLKEIYHDSVNKYQKRAIAWELALFYANKHTIDGAKQALKYIPQAIDGIKDGEFIRRATIIETECYGLLGRNREGTRRIENLLHTQEHPDLYLALANVCETIEERMKWINRVLQMYDLEVIQFANNKFNYDHMVSKSNKVHIDGPKVSIIIPAYNSEIGVKTAIDSLLNQSWQNIEILVVDDCSTDATAEVTKTYEATDKRVKYLKTPKNSGPYIARNIALKEASGEFITVNDADDWSHPRKIEIQACHLMGHPEVIANTSSHARITEEFKVYRRGQPGNYIFSNMSSLMFRRAPILEKVGYWDSVRFAADSEFKRRIQKIFGHERVVDLDFGPLSFPRQSEKSLTGSSAFGYDGFLMGARKEYAEAYRAYHNRNEYLYYDYPIETRPFPVPVPMLPHREGKPSELRHVQIVYVSDFRISDESQLQTMAEIKEFVKLGYQVGLVQMSDYHLKLPKAIHPKIREIIDGEHVQVMVYGENIHCDVLILKQPSILEYKQKYIPNIEAEMIKVVLDQPIRLKGNRKNIRKWANHLIDYFGRKGKWYPLNHEVTDILSSQYVNQLSSILISKVSWVDMLNKKDFAKTIEEWFPDVNPNVKKDESNES